MFEKFTEKMKKYPGKKYMDLPPDVRDDMANALQDVCNELAEFLGSTSIIIQLSNRNGNNTTHYYHECGGAQLINMMENVLPKIAQLYDPGVFRAISAYNDDPVSGDGDDGSDLFARVVSNLPKEQQQAIKSELIKLKKKLQKKEERSGGKDTSTDEDDSDAINDLLG